MAGRDSLHRADADSPQPGLVIDAVCGMTVDPAAGGPRVEFGGEAYYFCSERCAERFQAEPEAFSGHDHDGGGHGRASAAPLVGADGVGADEVVGVHLPDAPGDPSAWPWCVPDLRDGP